MDALAEVGHEVAKRAGLPPLVERLETFGNAIGGRRDLVRVDRVELFARVLRVPENERLAADQRVRAAGGRVGGPRSGQTFQRDAGLKPSFFNQMQAVHLGAQPSVASPRTILTHSA